MREKENKMDKLNVLREKAVQLLQQNANDERERKKFELICEKLKDDSCFLNMDIEHSYAVLRDLGIEESSVKAIYSDLISR